MGGTGRAGQALRLGLLSELGPAHLCAGTGRPSAGPACLVLARLGRQHSDGVPRTPGA